MTDILTDSIGEIPRFTATSFPNRYRNGDPRDRRISCVLDVEISSGGLGLSAATDRIIELGIVLFKHDDRGRVFSVLGRHRWTEDPGRPLTAEETALTGLSDSELAGTAIDDDAVGVMLALVSSAGGLVIAHHAGFDRRRLERRLPAFKDMNWACSRIQIDWPVRGLDGRSLQDLTDWTGFLHDQHRALSDAGALLHVLATPDDLTGEAPLAELLDNARAPRRVWAGKDYRHRNFLKERGYTWLSEDGVQSWVRDLPEGAATAEIFLLRRQGLSPRLTGVTARDRFSVRETAGLRAGLIRQDNEPVGPVPTGGLW